MTSEPVELVLTIGGRTYTWTGVADPADAMFAVTLGRAISEVVLRHGEQEEES